jgi:hypothetical protein
VRRRNAVLPSLLLASLSVVVLAHPAAAALCATWDPPAPGVVGAPASVSFRTSVPVATTGDDYVLEPHAFRDYPFRVRVLSPDGAASNVSMSPDSVDDRVWRASLTPDVQGRWTLIITNMQGSDTACYTHAVLVVHGEAGDRTPTYVTVGVVMVLGASPASRCFGGARRRRVV